MDYRKEQDALGEVLVPKSSYWGAQTQRSHMNFPQDTELMPLPQIYALAVIKKAAAICNYEIGKLDKKRRDIIVSICDEILDGKLDEHFPLVVWQTGSGTQTNMNVNEVIANRGNELANEKLLHPNDHVNMSQSSNDIFPTAMHISVNLKIKNDLIPVIDKAIKTLHRLSEENKDVIKTGRTHLQDATPVTLGQEISAWKSMLTEDRKMIAEAAEHLNGIAIGGTAVGTGLNAPKNFDKNMVKELSKMTGLSLVPSTNKFQALSSKGPITFVHSSLKVLATDLYKIANDIRFLSCGPRSGIGEIMIPANEPGSSIMPGKVNPTQVESMTMICIQVMANDAAVGMASSQGQLQLNAYMPLIIYNVLQSVDLLSKGTECFNKNLLEGVSPEMDTIQRNLKNSLMLVTSLTPHIGYDKASKIAKHAYNENLTLKEAALKLDILSEEEFDLYVDPKRMV